MVTIVGLGPGHESYIMPAAIEAVKSAEMVIGAKRNLEAVLSYCKDTMDYTCGFETMGDYLGVHYEEPIAVVVSGDTGFHSMLAFVKRHVPMSSIKLVPGISSLQYMYSKLGRSYENAKWLSLHGREADLTHYLEEKVELGLLTDRTRNNQYIGALLHEYGIKGCKVYVGERLSYDDEKITGLSVLECVEYKADPLSVVVITYE